MNSIITFILGFILFVLIVLAIVFHKSIKNIKKAIRQAADAREARKVAEEEAYFKRTSTKYYREEQKPNFKKDYFKGAEEKPKTKPQRPEQKPEQKPQQEQQPKQESATRRTVDPTSGVTIIDDRGKQQADRKIFDDNEGEYVDFVEVND